MSDKSETRYTYVEVPITTKEAQEIRNRQLDALQEQSDEFIEQIVRLGSSPLPKTRKDLVAIGPEHPDYKNAQFEFSPFPRRFACGKEVFP
jgi:hypothetical protein